MGRDFAGSGAGTYISCGSVGNNGVVSNVVAFTVACWFQLDGIAANNDRLMSRWGATNQWLLLRAPAAGITLDVIDGIVGSPGREVAGATANVAASTTWVHAAAVWVPTTRFEVWRNGSLDSAYGGPIPTTLASNASQPLTIAADPDSHNFGIDGRIAECGYWNIGLAPDEFRQLARGVPPFLIRSDALIGYWPLWDSGTTVAPDLHAQNQFPGRVAWDGAITGATIAAAHPPMSRV